MSTHSQSPSNEQLGAYNYCISFLDLLGQREALRGEGWLPHFQSDEDRKQFLRKLKNSIGSIMGLQQQAEPPEASALAWSFMVLAVSAKHRISSETIDTLVFPLPSRLLFIINYAHTYAHFCALDYQHNMTYHT